jgi:hypothetical protein
MEHLYTDAAKGLGYAAVLRDHWFYGVWSPWWTMQNITLLELVPIVLAVETWSSQLHNRTVIFHTDNMALVSVINRLTSKETTVMKLVRRLVGVMLHGNILCQAKHIPGKNNSMADALSRLQVTTFRKLHLGTDLQPTQHPPHPPSLPPWSRGDRQRPAVGRNRERNTRCV